MKTRNKFLNRFNILGVGLATVLAFGLTACKANPSATNTSATDASGSADAADGNLAPVDGSQPTQVLGQSASYAPQQQSESYPEGQQAPAPIQQGAYVQGESPDQYADQYNAQGADDYATQAPPPLPDYDQPPAPDPNYIWTPGYWGWGDAGYYWVPGVWCPPPYYGALWTPPYWGFYGGRYGFHHGYWGLHIGFYGGVDYGFGYIGIGYFGGYWHGNNFYYNSAVNNVHFNTNVYSRPVVYNNVHYGMRPTNRVSYNGGQGGINVRPRPAEMAAARESHTGPIAAQSQVRTAAAGNREQLFSANHGRPAQTAFARPAGTPAGAPHIAEAPAAVRQEQQRSVAVQQRNMQAQQHPAAPENRAATPQAMQRAPEAQHAAPQAMQRGPEPQHTMPAQQQRPAEPQHVAPQARPEQAARPAPEARPAPMARPQEAPRPAPEARPAPISRPAPAPRPAPEARPAPAPRPAPAARPAPAPRPAARPAPAPHEEPHR